MNGYNDLKNLGELYSPTPEKEVVVEKTDSHASTVDPVKRKHVAWSGDDFHNLGGLYEGTLIFEDSHEPEEKKEQVVKVAKPQKNDEGEWVVKVYVDGKYDEGKTYYANDEEDAKTTRDKMISEFKAKDCCKVVNEGFLDRAKARFSGAKDAIKSAAQAYHDKTTYNIVNNHLDKLDNALSRFATDLVKLKVMDAKEAEDFAESISNKYRHNDDILGLTKGKFLKKSRFEKDEPTSTTEVTPEVATEGESFQEGQSVKVKTKQNPGGEPGKIIKQLQDGKYQVKLDRGPTFAPRSDYIFTESDHSHSFPFDIGDEVVVNVKGQGPHFKRQDKRGIIVDPHKKPGFWRIRIPSWGYIVTEHEKNITKV